MLLPVSNDVNSDFGEAGHLNPAAKLYLLYRDTDIDFAWQGKGSRPARFGMDFSRNIAIQFRDPRRMGAHPAVHQSRSPTRRQRNDRSRRTRPATCWDCAISPRATRLTSPSIIATARATPSQEFRAVLSVGRTRRSRNFSKPGSNALVQKALSLSQGSYGRPNAGKDYLYFRAQQKDALGIVYFQPAMTAMMNWQDRSYQVTPELQYTGVKNLELRAEAVSPAGRQRHRLRRNRQGSSRLEFRARYYF